MTLGTRRGCLGGSGGRAAGAGPWTALTISAAIAACCSLMRCAAAACSAASVGDGATSATSSAAAGRVLLIGRGRSHLPGPLFDPAAAIGANAAKSCAAAGLGVVTGRGRSHLEGGLSPIGLVGAFSVCTAASGCCVGLKDCMLCCVWFRACVKLTGSGSFHLSPLLSVLLVSEAKGLVSLAGTAAPSEWLPKAGLAALRLKRSKGASRSAGRASRWSKKEPCIHKNNYFSCRHQSAIITAAKYWLGCAETGAI